MDAQVLYDQKWHKLLRRVWLFQFIPGVDFVLAAGSMALKDVHRDSDFDVIVGTTIRRMFTARFFCVLAFGLLGWRRPRGANCDQSRDKFCFNHFVTPVSYRLSPPYNLYWQKLYLSLAPVYGNRQLIKNFFQANEGWSGKKNMNIGKQYFLNRFPIDSGMTIEKFGFFGDGVEKLLSCLQKAKIKKSLREQPLGYKPRLIVNDSELEFHPDTRRIEEKLRGWQTDNFFVI